MERIGENIVRLQMPEPFVLFHGIPPNSAVHVRVHGWMNRNAELYELDWGLRPPAFRVPAGGVPPAAVDLRIPQALVFLGQGGPAAPGPREDEYAYQYVWAPFAPAVQGAVVPHGKSAEAFVMPAPNTSPDPQDLPVLRFRWRGANVVALVNAIAGAGNPGPYAIDLTAVAGGGVPVVPGTVRIVAPDGAGGFWEARDWPWPTAREAMTHTTGRLIGDVEPSVDSTIDYATGQVVITFPGNVPAPPPQIQAAFEWAYGAEPMDVRVEYDVNAI